MSFSSWSSNKKHYKNAHQGSTHYQKKGILSNLFNLIGSRSSSQNNYNNYLGHNNTPMYNQPIVNHNAETCSRCHSQIPTGSKFCLQCGEKVSDSLFCMMCGEKLPSGAKFCLKCGNKVG